jgi:hypothetical protein
MPVKVVKAKSSASVPGRTTDPDRTMTGILEVATVEFAEKYLDGARIDAIAAPPRPASA